MTYILPYLLTFLLVALLLAIQSITAQRGRWAYTVVLILAIPLMLLAQHFFPAFYRLFPLLSDHAAIYLLAAAHSLVILLIARGKKAPPSLRRSAPFLIAIVVVGWFLLGPRPLLAPGDIPFDVTTVTILQGDDPADTAAPQTVLTDSQDIQELLQALRHTWVRRAIRPAADPATYYLLRLTDNSDIVYIGYSTNHRASGPNRPIRQIVAPDPLTPLLARHLPS